jgi:hypothetical protein
MGRAWHDDKRCSGRVKALGKVGLHGARLPFRFVAWVNPLCNLGWGGAVAGLVSHTVGRGQKREKGLEWAAD